MNKIYLAVLLLFFSQRTFSQNQLQSFDPFPALGGATDHIYDIAFDSQNHPWVGSGYVNASPREIAWYDGAAWNYITAPPLVYNSIRQIEFDHNGVLWIAGGYYLASYNNGNWNVYTGTDMGLPDTSFNVTGLVVDQQNNIWFLTIQQPDHYLVKYDGTAFTYFNVTQMANDTTNLFVNGLKIDAANNIYLESPNSDAILVFDGTTFSPFNFFGLSLPSGYDIDNSYFDHVTNDFWVTLTNSDTLMMARYSSGTWQFTPSYYPPNPLLFESITVDMYGKVWLSDGATLVNYDGTAWSSWPLNLALPSGFITDNLGNLWLTLEGNLTVHRFYASPHESIQGTVWYDINMDGIIDPNEPGMPGVSVDQQPDNWTSLTSSIGNYMVAYLDSSLTYTVSVVPPLYWAQTIPAGPVNVNPSSQPVLGVNFGVAPIPGITDVRISVSAMNPRPGFNSQVYISYYNAGTDTVSDTITYTYDSTLTFTGSNPPPDVINGNTLQWLYSSLLPMNSGSITLYFHLDSLAAIGDTLLSSASIGPVSTDTVAADNFASVVQVVRGSFDPNEKAVLPEGDINPGERLYYTIFFQNTGTDTAFTVIIRDTLDANLDAASFRLEGMSHQATATISSEGGLEFRFHNILLPDSNVNEQMSHGYISYSIVSESNLPHGTPIENTASIYFDFNQPVVTNTTQTLINNPVSVHEITADGFMIYPNPSSHEVIISLKEKTEWQISIHSILGEEVFSKTIFDDHVVINVKDFANGFYFLNAKSKSVFLSEKFLKQ